MFRVNSRLALSNHFQTRRNHGMQYPSAASSLGAGLLRNPHPSLPNAEAPRSGCGLEWVYSWRGLGGRFPELGHPSEPRGCQGAGTAHEQISSLANGSRRVHNSSVPRAGRNSRTTSPGSWHRKSLLAGSRARGAVTWRRGTGCCSAGADGSVPWVGCPAHGDGMAVAAPAARLRR